jgi:glutathione S-transferase
MDGEHNSCTSSYTKILILSNRKVAFVMDLLGLSYESIYLDMQKGEHKAPDYLKINPNGSVEMPSY